MECFIKITELLTIKNNYETKYEKLHFRLIGFVFLFFLLTCSEKCDIIFIRLVFQRKEL